MSLAVRLSVCPSAGGGGSEHPCVAVGGLERTLCRAVCAPTMGDGSWPRDKGRRVRGEDKEDKVWGNASTKNSKNMMEGTGLEGH